jgi:hypothetical protein
MGIYPMGKRIILQVLLLLFFVSFCLGGYLLIRNSLQLPFRPTNDALHKKNSPITLDFLIPAKTYLNEKITISEVIKIRFRKEATTYERTLNILSDLIPAKYRYIADLILYLFWSFLFMTFLRIFTFMGYGKALLASLFLGGCTYYFMPDFTFGKIDDIIFIFIPLIFIFLRLYIVRGKQRKSIFKKDN